MFGRQATVIKNAINTEKFLFSPDKRASVRKQLGILNEFVVIFVGRLDPQNNPLFMLEIFTELKAIKKNSKLIVVGDGVLRNEMLAHIKDLNINDAVMMLGSRDDVNDLLQAADAFLLPSKFEGLGIVLI